MNPRRWLSFGTVKDTDGDSSAVGRPIQGMPINGSRGSMSEFPLAKTQSLPAAAAAVPGLPLSISSMTSIGEESGNKKPEEQPCRLKVTITKVKDLGKGGVGSGSDLNEFVFHLFVGQAEQTSKVIKYRPDEDGVSEVNASFLFDVPGVEQNNLRVHAHRKELWGLRRTSKIGVCPAISIAGLFSGRQQQQNQQQQQQQQQPSSGSGCGGVGYGGTNERVARGSWIALQQKKGLREENVGMVYLDLLALRAPETVEQLSVLVGTWNVGNTPPPSDLSSWLPRFAVTKHAHHHIDLRESSNIVAGKAEAAAKATGEVVGQAVAAGGGVGDDHLQEQVHPVQKQREAYQELEGEGGQRENLKGRSSEERQRLRPHHIVAIGAQECDYEPPKPYKDTAAHWVASLWDHLGRPTYNLVKATSRGQMRLVVFVHHDYELAVRDVESITEATGAGNVMANKGAVVVSLKYWDTTLCFVNSHFAAHAGQCEARNEDYREVVQHARVGMVEMDILNQFQHLFWMGDLNYRLDLTETEKGKSMGGVSMSSKSMLPFPLSVRLIPPQGGCWRDGSGNRSSSGGGNNVKNSERGLGGLDNSNITSTDSSSSGGSASSNGNGNGSNNISMNDDISIGSGVNSISSFKRKESRKKKKPKEDLWKLVVEKIAERKYDEMLTFDELRREQAMGRAFVGFQEGPIAFAPTFKVLRGKEEEYARSRAPAWCDRILRRSLPGCEDDLVLQSHYSAPSITTSDHKPVGAIFSLAVYTLPVQQPAPFGNFLNVLDYLVHFKKLKASGLKKHDVIGLLPDPCIVFLGPNVAGSVRTKSKKSTLNPEWNGETETPVVVLRASSIERLEREYLYLQVIDTSSFGRSEETLGYGVLPLREAARAFELTRGKPPGVPVPFKIELTRKGVVAGQLEGECCLTYERRCKYSRSCSARQLVMEGFRAGSRSFKENVSRLRDLVRRVLSQVTLLLRLRQFLGPAMETELASPVHRGRAKGEPAVMPSPPASELACFPSSPDPPRFFRLRTKVA